MSDEHCGSFLSSQSFSSLLLISSRLLSNRAPLRGFLGAGGVGGGIVSIKEGGVTKPVFRAIDEDIFTT